MYDQECLRKSFQLTLYFLSSASNRAIFFSMLSARESTFATQSLMSTELDYYMLHFWSVLRIRIRDPVLLNPGSIRDPWWKKIRIRDPRQESRIIKFWVKNTWILCVADPGSRIKCSFDPSFRDGKMRIRVNDKHPESATLLLIHLNNEWTTGSGLGSTISIMNTNILQNTNLLNSVARHMLI